jgi:hypothetical protein
MNLMLKSRELEVTMTPSSRTLKWKIILMKKVSSMSFWPPYTPQQNGVAERKNRTLIKMTRTMFDEYKTSDRFWTESVNIACHVINRLYLHKLLKKTPYELLTGNKPNASYFRVF